MNTSLRRIIAEWFYLKENKLGIPFDEQDSNIQDYYCRIAKNKIPQLVAGYWRKEGIFVKIVRGSIRSFINSHGLELNKENSESLVKRIVSGMRNIK